MDKLNVAVVGAGRRASGAWIPTIDLLKDQLNLVAVCNTGAPRGEEQANKYGVKWYSNVEKMLDEQKLDFVAVIVNPANAHIVSKAILERGISVVTETPIASAVEDADMLIALAKEKGAYIETAENLYRMPSERIKRELILNGVFGKILRGHNNNLTHDYHAVSLVRSYIGFDVKIKRVIGIDGNFSVAEHNYRGSKVNSEYTCHEIYFFENGALGFSHFTNLTWGSPLRGISSTEFYGENGMAVGDKIFMLKDKDDKKQINIQRLTCNVDGMDVLDKFVADTDPEIVWDNPFKKYKISDGLITIASELASIMKSVRENVEPEYGAFNGRIDRQIDLAISQSHREGNIPIDIEY
ncbi:TPA: Gfo/Idh/MocA family oxidoreductase [bacterium]|nr:Gfo/Idh/MocA family oxidoreductase [bacterium]